MKKLLILFLAFGLLTACNNNKTKADKTTDTEKTDKDGKDNKDNTDIKTTNDTDNDNKTTGGWPQKDRDDFLGSCIDKAYESSGDRPLSEAYCECMLGKIEEKYPDVQKAAALSQTEIEDLMRQYAAGCRGDK